MRSFADIDRKFMARALELAQVPVSAPHPNPRVGCLIVQQGEVVGEGFHQIAGSDHAEVMALKSAGKLARNAEMYVTLEPCAIHGRTPPCVDRVVESGIARVIIPSEDPNPATKGQGIKRLHDAGIKVEVGVLKEEARQMNIGFFVRHEEGRVWVTVKVGATLDGRIATASGESQWITSEASRQDVQSLRAQASAILTGIGTVIADNPKLNCRARGASSTPLKVIVDSNLRCPSNSQLFADEGEVVIATSCSEPSFERKQLESVAEVVDLNSDAKQASQARVNCAFLLDYLAKREINQVLVEAGPTLVGSLLNDELVDEMIVYMAPSMLGDSARGMASMPSIQSLSQRVRGHFTDVQELGDDLRITFRLHRSGRT